MGNQQSAVAPRRLPTKLTKPRTNTSTSNLLTVASMVVSRRSSNNDLRIASVRRFGPALSVEDVVDAESDHNGRARSKTRRRSLFRSGSTQAPSEATEGSVDVESEVPSSRPSRFRKLRSMSHETLKDVRAGREARPPNRRHTYQPKQSPAKPPEQEAVESKQMGDNDKQSQATTSLDRRNSDRSIPIPIRRRSLQTPGIATRMPSKESLPQNSLPTKHTNSLPPKEYLLPSPPAQEELQNIYYDPPKLISSPLKGIAVLDSEDSRAMTPSDLDYRHIGAFKFGSLRITNGSSSPSSRRDESRSVGSLGTTRSSAIPKLHLECLNLQLNGGPKPGASRDIPTLLGRSRSAQNLRLGGNSKIISTTIEIRDQCLEVPSLKQKQSWTQDIDSMSQVYKQDIASSPFSFEESPTSPMFRATSRKAAVEDHLFDDEQEALLSRMLSFAREPEQFETPGNSLCSQQPRTAQSSRETTPENPLVKADSGYCSLRSRSSISDTTGKARVSLAPLEHSCNTVVTSSTTRLLDSPTIPDLNISGPTSFSGSKRKPQRFSLPVDDRSLRPAVPPKSPSYAPCANRTAPHRAAVEQASGKPSRTSTNLPKMPTGRHSLPALVSTRKVWRGPSGSDSSISIKCKIQKSRAPSKPEVIVQGCTGMGYADIPAVSQYVTANLDERIKNFPALTHTYKSVHRTNSKETLATIFSMASAEQAAEQMTIFSRLNGPLPSIPSNERSVIPRNGFPIMSNAYRGNERSRSPRGRLKHRESPNVTSQEDFEQHITCFGTISESLGASPYDVAGSIVPTKNLQGSVASQSISARCSPNPSMGSIEALQFARERSRIRENKRHLPRRQNYEGRRVSGRGGTPGKIPGSAVGENVPPVLTSPAVSVQNYGVAKKSKHPPVSITTQKKLPNLPVSPTTAALSAREAPAPPARAAPQPPVHANRQGGMAPLNEDPWEKQRKMRTERANQGLKQTETLSEKSRRRPSFEQPRQLPSRPLSTRPSFERGSQFSYSKWSAVEPYSAHHQIRNEDQEPYQPQQHSHKLSRQSFDSSQMHRPRAVYPRPYANPEPEPLILDRYSGGMEFGYGSAYGLGGSAELRHKRAPPARLKGVNDNLLWGVDLSDVPVMEVIPTRRVETR